MQMVELFVVIPLVTGCQAMGGVRLSVYSKLKSAALVGQQKFGEPLDRLNSSVTPLTVRVPLLVMTV